MYVLNVVESETFQNKMIAEVGHGTFFCLFVCFVWKKEEEADFWVEQRVGPEDGAHLFPFRAASLFYTATEDTHLFFFSF